MGDLVRCDGCGRSQRIEGYGTKPPYWSVLQSAEDRATYLTLCRGCAARERGRRRKEPVEIEPGLVVTRSVERRLRRDAEAVITRTLAHRLLLAARATVFLSIVPLIIILGNHATDRYDAGDWPGYVAWGVFISGAFAGPLAVGWLILTPPISALDAQCEARLRGESTDLARRRQSEIEERQQFYQSAEWRAQRERVIAEEGNQCAHCGKATVADGELAVDHIKPRSRFPELALERSNLQVLCRRCNSAKGDR